LNTKTVEHLGSSHKVTQSDSLWARIMLLLGLLTLTTLMFAGVSVLVYTNRAERATWRGRQGEAVRAAASIVAAFVQNVTETLVLTDLMGHNELMDEPDIMLQVLERNPALMEITYLDKDGRVISSASRDRPVLSSLITIPQSQWFREARNGKQYLSSVQLSWTNQPYLIVALPATEGGVIAARLNMDILWQVVAEFKMGDKSLAYVINRHGRVIAHTHTQAVLDNTNLTGRPELEAILQAPDAVWFGTYVNLDGVPVVGASRQVEESDWIVIVELSQAEAYAITRRALYVLVGGLFLFMIVANVIAAQFLQRAILRPMLQLSYGAVRIGSGDLGHRIGLTSRNEIGQVARTFDHMAERLQDREGQLRAQAEALAVQIYEREQAEIALRESEARYRAIVEDQTELVCRWLPNGTLTFVNEAYCRYFDKAYDELVGHTFMPLILEEDQAMYQAAASILGSAQPVVTVEHRIIAPDGEIRWQQWTDRAIFDQSGAVIEYQSVGRDITERQLAEIALRELNEQLEERVSMRTSELTQVNADLNHQIAERVRAEAQLRASLQEKEMLLKEIHHRVKNNLQIISSLLNLQARQTSDAMGLDLLRDSQNRVRSMALIHEKLYLSSDLAQVNFADYVRNLIAFLMTSYQVSAATVSPEIDVTKEIQLDIDTAIPCGLIINELISNALKHAFVDGRAGQLWVEMRRTSHRCLELIVRDNGVGIPPDLQIQQARSLGLRLVTMLVEQIKGELEVGNDGGAMFRVTFPDPQRQAGEKGDA